MAASWEKIEPDFELRAQLTDLLIRLADGDRSAFEDFFAKALPIVRSFARRYLGQSIDAEDVAQEALLKIFARCQDFQRDSQALPWILAITAYECRTHLQKIKRRREQSSADADLLNIADPTQTQDLRLLERDQQAALSDLLEGLTPAERMPIMAAYFNEDRPEISPAAFRKRLQRGLEKLRLSWRAKYE